MSHLDIRQFICLDDNYGVVIHDSKTGATASIDAPDAKAIDAHLRKFDYAFIELFAPQLTRTVVQISIAGGGEDPGL